MPLKLSSFCHSTPYLFDQLSSQYSFHSLKLNWMLLMVANFCYGKHWYNFLQPFHVKNTKHCVHDEKITKDGMQGCLIIITAFRSVKIVLQLSRDWQMIFSDNKIQNDEEFRGEMLKLGFLFKMLMFYQM